ncbi:MAG TPA: sigma-54 dependent transcriptional regulator [Myxococcales bacterium]|nr:sigma-54 dependent transcriptional regulator [Myxococcales bacterium]
MARLLVVDDKDSIRTMLELRLSAAGHAVVQAENVESADRALRTSEFDVVITDLRMGRGGDGLDVLRKVKDQQPQTEVIVMTAFGSEEVRERALELGALCYLEKSSRLASEVVPLVQRALEKRELALRGKSLAADNQLLREQLEARGRLGDMVGRSAAMQSVFQLVEKVAAARTTVLITGESGVGKELVARAVHERSPRGQGPFVPVNCGAIPEGLIESELFGHVKGAFTGAAGDKQGLFQTAQGGTLFLDEIAELPTALQVKLLRAIQDRRIRPVGGTEDIEVDVRIVAATNRDLPAEVRGGRFREDLYYRLNVVQVRVPPLRERREDILPLADHFLTRFGVEHQRPALRLSREARRRLDEYDFPGNVRELENLIERAVALSNGDEVTLDALPVPLRGTPALPADGPLPQNFSLEAHLASIERELIDRALSESRGVKKDAAAKLGLTFRQFRHRLKKLSGEPDTPENGDTGDAELS